MLGQCPELVHLNLSWAESLAGVLAQCTALAELNLSNNWFGDAGAEVSQEC